MSHDKYFKNLIMDYLREALRFLAPAEAGDLPESVKITLLRQEQAVGELTWPFRETDLPLMPEFPDGRRDSFIILIEEESKPGRFDILRLIEYCTGIARMWFRDSARQSASSRSSCSSARASRD